MAAKKKLGLGKLIGLGDDDLENETQEDEYYKEPREDVAKGNEMILLEPRASPDAETRGLGNKGRMYPCRQSRWRKSTVGCGRRCRSSAPRKSRSSSRRAARRRCRSGCSDHPYSSCLWKAA